MTTKPPILRQLTRADTVQALRLYNQLTFGPPTNDRAAFHAVLDHPGTSIMGAFVNDTLSAMVTLHLLPNVTWQGRPYALIENVVTAEDKRREGLGKATLNAALEQAWKAGAYKVMLMTGKKRGARGFYQSVGFSSEDKDAMVIRRP